MDNKDILETRILVASVANVPPDNIEVTEIDDQMEYLILFCIPYIIHGTKWDLVTVFSEKPTEQEIKDQVDFLIAVGYEMHQQGNL